MLHIINIFFVVRIGECEAIIFCKYLNIIVHKNAFSGNRTRGRCLEGTDVTTTPRMRKKSLEKRNRTADYSNTKINTTVERSTPELPREMSHHMRQYIY